MILLYTLLLLVATATLIYVVPPRVKFLTAFVLIAAVALIASGLALHQLTGNHISLLLWQMQSPLFGTDAGSIDPLSALFALLISIGSVSALFYARDYRMNTPAQASLHYAALVTLCLSMLGTVVSEGGFSFLLFWELTTISTWLLLHSNGLKNSSIRIHAIRMHIGLILLVTGFVWLELSYGAADFPALSGYFHEHAALPLFLLFLAGFGIRVGLLSCPSTLTDTTPTHISALQSGVLILTAIYGILRTTLSLRGVPTLGTAGTILLILGIATAIRGTMFVLRETDTKRVFAYSGLRNIGIILIGIGIAALGKHTGNLTMAMCGISGALLHTFNHSFSRSLLLFGTGALRSKGMFSLAGLLSVCALPPLGGFVSELIICVGLYDGIATESSILASTAGLVTITLTGGFTLLVFNNLWNMPSSHPVAKGSRRNGFRLIATAIPLFGLLFTGLVPQTAAHLVLRAAGALLPGSNTQMGNLLLHPTLSALGGTIWLLLIVIGLLCWLRQRVQPNL